MKNIWTPKSIWQRQHVLNDAIEQIKVDRVIKIVDEVEGGARRSQSRKFVRH